MKTKVSKPVVLLWNLFLFVCFASCPFFTNAASKSLELVTLQYPPYEFEYKGKVDGIAVRLVKAAFERFGQPVKIELLPWARALLYIETGRVDALFTAYKTNERAEFADYSREILIPQTVSLFVRSKSNITFDGDLKKLSQHEFGVVSKVSYGSVFDNAVRNGVIQNISEVRVGELNVAKLLAGRMDILVSNKYGALDILSRLNLMSEVKELTPAVQTVPSYLIFSKKRKLSNIRDQFDQSLRAMKKDGTYQAIIDNYFAQLSLEYERIRKNSVNN